MGSARQDDGVREVSAAEVAPRAPAPDAAAIRAAYRQETARALHGWLGLAATIFLFFIGIGSLLEWFHHPARGAPALVFYLDYTIVWVLALVASRHPRGRARTALIAMGLEAAVAILLSGYAATVGAEAEIYLMAHICLMCGLASVVPLGWRAQLPVSIVSPLSLWLAAPYLVWTMPPTYVVLGIVAGAFISLIAAASVESYRYTAFARSTLLAHASALTQEEADIATALFHVGQALEAHLGETDLVARINRLAVEALGCDDSYIYLWDERRHAFRLSTDSGLRPEIRARIADVEFSPDWPLIVGLRPGHLLEMPDCARQRFVSRTLLRVAECASLLDVPLCRGEERVGVIILSHRHRTGAFSAKEHRLAFGIAHAASVALETARLIATLQDANRLKSEFLSTMSHELRTPLNVITGYADILAERGFGPLTAEQAESVERIRQSTRDQLDLIDASIDLNRLEAGRDVVDVDRVDVDALFAEIRHDLRAADSAIVGLRWRNAVDGRPVLTDRVKLKAIIKHLVSNALKFTARGEVEVAIDEDAGRLCIRVRDTGIGIAASDLPTIFEMFRQVDGSNTRPFGGVGLGLYIVKRLVERLHGEVTVASAPGVGSVFTVTLPASPITAGGATR
jgi:signal transduction histidine kinase